MSDTIIDIREKHQILAVVTASIGAISIGSIFAWSMLPTNPLAFGTRIWFLVIRDNVDFVCCWAVLGSLLAGKLMHQIGHRYGIVLFQLLVTIGWLLVVLTKSGDLLYVGGVLLGLGVGATSTIIPAYVGEISEPYLRGRLGTMFYSFFIFGSFHTLVLATRINIVTLKLLCMVWPVIQIFGVIFMIDSPFFLLRKDRQVKAKESLTKLRYDKTEEEIANELSAIKIEIDEQKNMPLISRTNIRAMLVSLCLVFVLGLANVKVIQFYMIYNCKLCEEKFMSLEEAAKVIILFQAFMTVVTVIFIDKVGRRALLMTSAILTTLSAAIVCILQEYYKNLYSISLTFLIIHVLAFTLGFGPVIWVIIGEIFPMNMKGFGTSLVVAIYWFGVGFHSVDDYNMVYNNVFFILGLIVVKFWVPETKDKSLAEIRKALAGNHDLSSDRPV